MRSLFLRGITQWGLLPIDSIIPFFPPSFRDDDYRISGTQLVEDVDFDVGTLKSIMLLHTPAQGRTHSFLVKSLRRRLLAGRNQRWKSEFEIGEGITITADDIKTQK